MKNLLQILVACTLAQAIQISRPGAEWALDGNSYDGIRWLDVVQTKPTKAELLTAASTCDSNETTRLSAKAQAKIDVKNTTLTQAQRFRALLILLDYDQ